MWLKKISQLAIFKKVWFNSYYKVNHGALQGADAAGTSLKYEDKNTCSLDQMQH